MAEASHVGMTCECPHCYAQLEIPSGDIVNKDKFVEPRGLRRVLKQVQDQEWEMLRRKLRAAKAHSAELEAELHRAQAALAERAAAPKPTDEKVREVETLRKQLAEMSDKLVHANQAFIAGQKQQEAVAESLRNELGAVREELEASRAKNAELLRTLKVAAEATAKLQEKMRDATGTSQTAAELERVRKELAETQSKLEVEQAKVLVMEAAGVSADMPGPVDNSKNDELVEELQMQIEELRKSNDSLRAARDKAHAQVVELQKKTESRPAENQQFEAALGNLESGLNEVLALIAARKLQAA